MPMRQPGDDDFVEKIDDDALGLVPLLDAMDEIVMTAIAAPRFPTWSDAIIAVRETNAAIEARLDDMLEIAARQLSHIICDAGKRLADAMQLGLDIEIDHQRLNMMSSYKADLDVILSSRKRSS